MKVRLNKDCPFNKITVTANGMVIIVTKEWTYVPSDQFVRNGMEVEGQEKQKIVEQPKEIPKVIAKEPVKPVVYVKSKKK